MTSFFEPLILYWVLFFRISAGAAVPDSSVEFSEFVEIARIVSYSIPSLLLVWYLMLKIKPLKEWGITLPRKRDIIPATLAFSALFLIGLTISLVSPHINRIPASPRFLPPRTIFPWVILVVSCFSTAYLEETFFRMYLLSKRKEMRIGPHRAILLSTLLFSICHVYEGPWGFLNAALSGVVLAFVFVRFQSLHGVAVAHALYNILVFVLGSLPAGPQ